MIEAIPTEFGGITYRSKSEAMFALCLEYGGFNFSYEDKPDLSFDLSMYIELRATEDDGIDFDPHTFDRFYKSVHPWDFKVCTRSGYKLLIEYKPKHPSETYIENLRRKLLQYSRQRIESDFSVLSQASERNRVVFLREYGWEPAGEMRGIGFYVVYGNAWDQDYGMYDITPANLGGKVDVNHSLGIIPAMQNWMSSAKSYRFDLSR